MVEDSVTFDIPEKDNGIIKVIGVGGGGSNAVNHMFRQGIKGVSFVVCNTDNQALQNSPIATRIQLGRTLTFGRGAGNEPSMGREAAIESFDDIRRVLEKGTKMVFLTAGMGGGTGTGAAPVIAQAARELNILTVAIVTLPFSFEGDKRWSQAIEGIKKLKEYVDALLIIYNDRLREIHGNQKLSVAFGHADNVLTMAAKGIAEIITVPGYVNVDFADVRTVMERSGVAIMGTGVAEGENRAHEAISSALNSPLLNNNNLKGARNILLNVSSGAREVLMDEITEIMDYVQFQTGIQSDVIWGNTVDPSLGEAISVTIVATGLDQEIGLGNLRPDTTIREYLAVDGFDNAVPTATSDMEPEQADNAKLPLETDEEQKVFTLEDETPDPQPEVKPARHKGKNQPKSKNRSWFQSTLDDLFKVNDSEMK